LLAALSGFVPTLFSQNPDVISVTRLFLWVVPISYGTYGMVMVMNAAFNGLGNPMPAVYISIGRIVLLYLPFAFAGLVLFGMVGIFVAYTLANVVSGVLAYVWARRSAQQMLAGRR
jgi:Na+-driven multidrug efflux pump